MAEPTSPPTGYRLVLPSDWVQIPLRTGDTERTVRDVVAAAFARVPADVPRDKPTPLRLELERRLLSAVADARRAKALELYLPMRLAGEVNLGASIIVSETQVPSRSSVNAATASASDSAEIAGQLMSRDDGTDLDLSSGEVDGALAVRRERIVPAAADRGLELASRRVDYLVSVPGDPGRWFLAAFSTIGAGNPQDDLADALVEWFDALMATFRWSWA
ncbi:hypothetical protein SCNRRL3882_5133 [Streptomyces chartreusis NRRL 3882]|uniref:Uncharacterized protein n=1 Tax=Streptomyces chartreusis NRRL 3882 TaxID=1079985 RepID=A0A2N9BEC4_STRCX|nr:hypothetical protein [Streptomyces sp. SID5464]SOR81681.1 hypothetical protein SCNRRL3882_5133 [Streptomyces chartreusis NRRL 3882]